MIRRFLDWNKAICQRVDSALIGDNDDQSLLKAFLSDISGQDDVADVGGGKKPAKVLLEMKDPVGATYDGFDLDLSELQQAQQNYSAVYAVDITDIDPRHGQKYDRVICKSTLEHVLDAEGAMAGLTSLLRDGGQLYIGVPYRYAVFAVLNRLLPNETKRKVLHYIFPNKAGDGFPAYYLDCRLSDLAENAARNGLRIAPGKVNKIYSSSYFTFFVPLYLLWRMVTAVQYTFDRDYCERFEVVFEKPLNPSR